MAFRLNVHGTYPTKTRSPSMTERVLGARQQVRWRNHIGYFESPRMHVMSAALMFLTGVSLASINLNLTSHHAYDMTPTGSIALKPTTPPSKSCP